MAMRAKGPGDVILGRFVIEQQWGGMAIVYLVHDRDHPERRFIAKRLRPEHLGNQHVCDWFFREAEIWGRVSEHPNVVSLMNRMRMDTDGTAYFFVEYVRGLSLRKLIQAAPGQRLSVPQALEFAGQIATGMEYATVRDRNGHGVFVHRNLEAGNILVSRECQAKISGWSLGKDLAAPEDAVIPFHDIEDFTDGLVGKCRYMPPEMFAPRSSRGYGIPGDIYFFGGIVYEMLLGAAIHPLEEAARKHRSAETKEEVWSWLEEHHRDTALPKLGEACPCPEMVDLFRDCIRVHEGDRIQTFTEVLERLDGINARLLAETSPGTYQVCSGCGLILDEAPSACPLCTGTEFEPWTDTPPPG